ncbi:uncharacterized protein LOC100845407 [Brachypodium distachyon]|uniref:FLZ-type domain-containing protein n=1 Tax=Brachypodium distachyon TaxID=15368 RepID=A0A0Q3FV10_BRADI|nr:uncharacterized protein LOC100845407 [Brachypodium distachyon]KQK01885.1 hypothetical protein BRADI_3g59070v3 [Brachypodium distachyon]|eukprot:XP_010236109.1 uncharacterized protein LOC100845407 [Brachypodium distachyon]
MLGKRQRSLLMRRTTSMASMPSAPKQGRQEGGAAGPSSSVSAGAVGGTGPAVGGAPSPWRADARNLAGVKTAAFLMACGLCSKDLGPGKDTYIYRGEVAFCSHECRERQIEKDELMEQNCSLTSIREAPPPSSAAGPDGGDAVAAA